MLRINDSVRLADYARQYEMNKIFTEDMTSFMELLFFRKNEFMVKEGDDIPYLLFLVEGKAKVLTSLSNGKSLLLCFYQGFKVLGDLEAVDSAKAMTNVQAISDTYCIGISCRTVRQHLLEDTKFLRFLCSSLGGKLIRCSKNSSINLLYPLENRLASYIYTAGERGNPARKQDSPEKKQHSPAGTQDPPGKKRHSPAVKQDPPGKSPCIIFHENLTEIAELLGTSYRHLLRTLAELCDKGVLRKEGNAYIVIDEKTLVALSADLYK